MKLLLHALLFVGSCAAVPGNRLGARNSNNPATDGVSGALLAKVSLACTLLQQDLGPETVFPGSANYTTENTGK